MSQVTLTPPAVPHHHVVRAIGRGSYGEIWLARSLTGAWRAVKIVDRARFDDERSFEREFDGMARFEPVSREHEGFVDILHVGRSDDGGFFYYVMELADDAVPRRTFDPAVYQPKTLKSELQRVARLPADEVITLGLSLTAALAALHSHGLVHRDIKPANIIFTGGVPKIADIGLVSAIGQDSFVGTEGYVPPEGHGTAQADIFSLGKVLYEIAMGKDRMQFPEVNTRIAEMPDKVQLMRLNEVLLRACARDTDVRYASAGEMQTDLENARDGRPLDGLHRRRRWLPIVGMLLVCATAFGVWKSWPVVPPAGEGSALVETEPAGAIVILEGRMLRSPAHFAAIKSGMHSARVMLPGYDPIDVPLKIAAGTEAKLPPVFLRRSVGSVRVESDPAGCDFEIRSGAESVKSGRTPADSGDLPTGPYEIVMRHEGGEKRAPFEVKSGESTPVSVRFGSGKFLVSSSPQGAEIFADGKSAGIAPCEIALSEGEHRLSARYPGWPAQERTVNAEPGPAAGIAFAFPFGSAKITSAPAGATVFFNGREIGVTPQFIGDLEPGERKFSLRLAGYRNAEVTAMVEAGKQAFVGARFERRPVPSRGEPWENSLGMKFVPVGDVLVCVWPTRVKDFQTFCETTGRARLQVDFPQDEMHPIVRVNWEDSHAFCQWLTEREVKAERLDDSQSYRLPSDAEWSLAAGIATEIGATPEERDGRVRDFAWGKMWPPLPRAGNFADTSVKRPPFIAGYSDGFPQTSPVGSFPANKAGLFDMTGNVWQWVADSYHGGPQRKDWGVLRGGSWGTSKQEELRLGYRDVVDRSERDVIFGFRCVLVPGGER
ncbi:MAG: bifunctional serine/threonine-protein kinase/formylglycine-generating enzyme family protein [Chthoniobacteraceae bacterium]